MRAESPFEGASVASGPLSGFAFATSCSLTRSWLPQMRAMLARRAGNRRLPRMLRGMPDFNGPVLERGENPDFENIPGL